MKKLVLENKYKIAVLNPTENSRIPFSGVLSGFPVVFKADLIYKDF